MMRSDAALSRAGSWAVRRRGIVLAVWFAAGAVLLPQSRRIAQSLEVVARVRGSESAAVDSVLRTRFESPFGTWAVLVMTGAPSPIELTGREVLQILADSLAQVASVTGTLSWLDRQDTTFAGRDGGTFLVVGLDPGADPVDDLVPPLRAATDRFQRALRTRYPTLALRWTGFVPFNYDLRRTSSADVAAAEARALPVTLALLLWAFGAVGAALLPLLAGVIAIGMALGMTVLLAHIGRPSILLVNVATMIGLGLGIDYALLIVSRFREAVAAGRTRVEAAADAARRGGGTIAISGLTVAIGFSALLGIESTDLRSVAVGGLIVTLFSVAIAATLLPPLLSWIGRVIEIGQVRPRRSAAPSQRWEAWGGYIARHPWRVLIAAGLPVLALALQTLRIETDVESGDWLPASMESTQGLEDLRAMGRRSIVAAMPVILELPADTPPLGEKAWNGVVRLGDWLAANPGVAEIRSLPALVGIPWSPVAELLIPRDVRRAFVSRDQRAVTLDVLPDERADRHDLARLVQRLRTTDAATLTGLPGARVQIGGISAFHVDYGAAVQRRFRAIVMLAIGGTLVALFIAFRSVLVPLKAVALNLLSVLSALGVLVLVFQDGHGVHWLGLDRPVGGVFSSVPLLVFCVVFGLSMDYEVFLVARIREARRRGCDERAALVEGLGRTASVITNAATIMVAVFAAFALGEVVVIKMLGVALAAAVALDATVVRLAIGPALLCIAGKWNWWPGMVPAQPAALPTGDEGP